MTKDEVFVWLTEIGFKPFYDSSLISVRVDDEKAMKKLLSRLKEVGYNSTIRFVIGKDEK